nr:migration and invasion enhancer 1 isoform X2 [Chlorocebus sabaeus]
MGQRAPCQGGTPATGVSSNMACPSIYRHPYHGGCALAPQRHPGEPCGFEATYLELASAVKEQYPGIEIESRLGGTGAFEIEINGQLVFSKLENGGFPYEKDLIEAIRRASKGEPLEKITNSRPPCIIL